MFYDRCVKYIFLIINFLNRNEIIFFLVILLIYFLFILKVNYNKIVNFIF